MFLIALAFVCSEQCFAQSVEKEPVAVVELGGAIGRGPTEGQSNFGPSFAVEVTPIENWLELEAGVTPLFSRRSTEWSVDLLFKKPGLFPTGWNSCLASAPEWIHTNANGIKMNSIAAEIAPDFMFWPIEKARNWLVSRTELRVQIRAEPEHSLGITAGLLIAIR